MDVIEKLYRKIERIFEQHSEEVVDGSDLEQVKKLKTELTKALNKLSEEIVTLKTKVDEDAAVELEKLLKKADERAEILFKLIQKNLDQAEVGPSTDPKPVQTVDPKPIQTDEAKQNQPPENKSETVENKSADDSIIVVETEKQTKITQTELSKAVENAIHKSGTKNDNSKQNSGSLPTVNQHEVILGNVTANKPVVQLKLDRLEIPTFGGELIEWISFRDQFIDLVHSNNNLSTLIKFHLLRNHLRGPALETVNG